MSPQHQASLPVEANFLDVIPQAIHGFEAGDIFCEYFDFAQQKSLYPRNDDIEKRNINSLIFKKDTLFLIA